MVSGHGEPNTPKISIPESQSYKLSVKRKFSDFVSKFFLEEEEADNQGQQPMFMQSISSSVKMTITNKERLADNFNIIFSDWEGEDSNYIHGKYLEHHPRTIKFRSMEVEQGSPFKLPRLKTAHSKTRYLPIRKKSKDQQFFLKFLHFNIVLDRVMNYPGTQKY